MFCKLIAVLFYLLIEAQKSYHRELKSHTMTVNNFEKFRENSEEELKKLHETIEKYHITITELTQAKEMAESSLQDTLTDMEAKESSLRSQYDSLKEEVDPLKKDSLLLNKLKNVFNEIRAPGNKPTDQLMNQFMEEKVILTGKVEVSQAEMILLKAQFESVRNQLSETQNVLTETLVESKKLKRRRLEKKSRVKKFKSSEEESKDNESEEDEKKETELNAKFESVQNQLSETQNALDNAFAK